MAHRFYTLDVFTTTRFEGNPLAVFLDADGLPDDHMQAIAREMNLSETVFVQTPTERQALARLRIFTVQQELKLAGHPVIGTWFLLADLGKVPHHGSTARVVQQTGAGLLPVEVEFHDGRPRRVTMTQQAAVLKPLRSDRAALAHALGLTPSDLHPSLQPTCVSTGLTNLMVPLESPAALAKITMNMNDLKAVLDGQATMAYCFAAGGEGKAFARGMLPWAQYEDPATGSAAGSLGAFLVAHGILQAGETLHILQGVEMGRPSHIDVEVRRTGEALVPRVSGASVRVLEGSLSDA